MKIKKDNDLKAKKREIFVFKRQKFSSSLISTLMAVLIGLGAMSAGATQPTSDTALKGIVVLDPGHGGRDTGAHGPNGVLEKEVTLTLARMVADDLKVDHAVTLTRSDDYRLDISNRTSVANHLKADLFISLHTGGSFLHSVSGTCVFYYQELSEPAPAADAPSLNTLTGGDVPIAWNHIQNRYLTSSKKMAQMMQFQLIDITQDAESGICGAPLLVLKGADMPAILIEVGYLTNPNEGRALADRNYLSLLAGAISKGVREYLSRKGN
jgi:N-acetylmuramoyl-L-alanine amidase